MISSDIFFLFTLSESVATWINVCPKEENKIHSLRLLTQWLWPTFCIFSFEFHLIDGFRVAEWSLNMEMDSTGYEWGEKLFRWWMVRPLTPAWVYDRPSFSQLIAVGRRLMRYRLFMTNQFVAYVFRHRYWVFKVHFEY